MKIKKIVLIILFLMVLILVYITNFSQIQDYIKINIQKYGEPIDIETGMINNKYFNINPNGENAQKTTEGLNKAIKYAKKNNIVLKNNEDEIIYDYIKKYYKEFYYGEPKNLLDELKSKLSCPTYEKLEELYYTAKKIKK